MDEVKIVKSKTFDADLTWYAHVTDDGHSYVIAIGDEDIHNADRHIKVTLDRLRLYDKKRASSLHIKG